MSIYLEESYIEKLEKYVGRKLNIIQREKEINVICDAESQYVLKEEDNHFSFYSIQRNQISKIGEYYSEEEMRRMFAITMRGFLGKEIDYSKAEEMEKIESISDVERMMELYVGKEYYSIMKPEKKKINLEISEKKDYNIYLLKENEERSYIEENLEAPFAFARFYNEALFLKTMLERIREYQVIFEETISEEETYRIIS